MIKKINVCGWPNPAVVDEADKERWIRDSVKDILRTEKIPTGKRFWRSHPQTTLSGDTLLEVTLVKDHDETYVNVREFLPRGGYKIKFPLDEE